jgi:hypothetical protein
MQVAVSSPSTLIQRWKSSKFGDPKNSRPPGLQGSKSENPTEEFHTRRVRWAFEKGLHDTGVEVHVVPIKAIGYSAGNWWLDERGLLAFQNKIVKSLYYWLGY